MIGHFRVATRASGVRRQVFVHVYDDQEDLARAHAKARGSEYDPDGDVAGGVSWTGDWYWPRPPADRLIVVMRLWTGQLTTRTIAHEATHAAAALYFADSLRGWHSRARAVLAGDHEPLAYLIGDIAAEVTAGLYAHHFLPNH